jgi:hypothetical protein
MRPLAETVRMANETLQRTSKFVVVDREVLADLTRIGDQSLRTAEAQRTAFRETNMTALLVDVCRRHNLDPAALRRAKRGPAAMSRARQEFMAAAYDTGRYSQPRIAAFLRRHVSTVTTGIQAHRNRMDDDALEGGLARAA